MTPAFSQMRQFQVESGNNMKSSDGILNSIYNFMLSTVIIDPEARDIIRLVASVHLFAC